MDFTLVLCIGVAFLTNCRAISRARRDRERPLHAPGPTANPPSKYRLYVRLYAVRDVPCMTRLTTTAVMPASTALAIGDDSMSVIGFDADACSC